ncbi:MAG: hypothetical protein AAF530_20900 [Pseudomonadota bacterium]
MSKLRLSIFRFLKRQDGVMNIEYAVLLSVAALILATTGATLGATLETHFWSLSDCAEEMTTDACE